MKKHAYIIQTQARVSKAAVFVFLQCLYVRCNTLISLNPDLSLDKKIQHTLDLLKNKELFFVMFLHIFLNFNHHVILKNEVRLRKYYNPNHRVLSKIYVTLFSMGCQLHGKV